MRRNTSTLSLLPAASPRYPLRPSLLPKTSFFVRFCASPRLVAPQRHCRGSRASPFARPTYERFDWCTIHHPPFTCLFSHLFPLHPRSVNQARSSEWFQAHRTFPHVFVSPPSPALDVFLRVFPSFLFVLSRSPPSHRLPGLATAGDKQSKRPHLHLSATYREASAPASSICLFAFHPLRFRS